MDDFQDTFTPEEIRFGPAEGRHRRISRAPYAVAVLAIVIVSCALAAVWL